MQFTAGQIAEFLHGEVDGNAQVLVHDVAKIEEGRSGTLTFLANPIYTEHVYSTAASVVIVGRDFQPSKAIPKHLTLLRVDDPRAAFARLLEIHEAQRFDMVGVEQPSFVSPRAKLAIDVYVGAFSYISEGAVVGEDVKIFPNCYIGEGVRIGKGCRIHAGVKVHANCVIGAHCVLHSGVVIGADGFGFIPNGKGEQEKMAQIGNVIIEDDVEIGANTTVDRATLGHTIIRKGAKLDNLIQVGHNVEIGAHTLVVAQTGIAGSTHVGSHCLIGGQVGIAGHLHIGDRVKIAAQSGIGSNIPDDAVVQGSPAFTIGEYKRSYVLFRNLPEMKHRLDQLERNIEGDAATGHGEASPSAPEVENNKQ
ncbi:MAG: UDP-3-O-(3-hydroxymyristoyl)glucosamine N-acyltransferase [Flavobacteriales bacterium]|jgi:UDP-3-O-[3-hydroxymyristoyl] glucosamine N-acyltransferase|nr:UDP-3-O-(3-hydroxymyristoyl)glucosamine N-acyltransferase [Flavobacteriales bacterium]MCB0758896.1 UDP-3-O-(3-hydroxymyristoyl)glucosamine N-acyltransferase [Flavobacteriales bacterium]